jgi:hypothetical protein
MMTSVYYNEWLDEYNDYVLLYKMFGDQEYLDEAVEIINSLKAMITKIEINNMIVSCVHSNSMHKFHYIH